MDKCKVTKIIGLSTSKRAYCLSEIKRLTVEGVAISKIAKLLGLEYKLATRLKDSIECEVIK